MKPILIALAVTLIGLHVPGTKTKPLAEDHPVMVRAADAARDLDLALDLELPDASPERRERFAIAAFGWSFFEASWYANPYGFPDGSVLPGTNDGGHACGTMQPHVEGIRAMPHWKGVVPWSCVAVRKDRVLGFRAGLRILLRLEEDCLSLCGALTAYSTDLACKPWTAAVVRKRSKELGLGCP